jgi:hypothetical protein
MNVHVGPGEKPQAMRASDTTSTVKTVNFALQGGGAHGAFTWGGSKASARPAPAR